MEKTNEYKFYTNELLLLATYRLIFEKADIETIIKELDQKKDFISFLKRLQTFSWKFALKGKSKLEQLSIKEAIPSFFIEHLLPVMEFDFLKKNIRYMNEYASQKNITLRINTLPKNCSLESLVNSIRKEFNKNNIKFTQDAEIPFIFHTSLKNKRKILLSDYYRNGNLIFQDKASAVIIQLLSPNSGEFICDMCAAPGIKSSLIAQLTKNEARVICNDFNNKRLKFTKFLLNHLKVSNFYLINSDGTNFPVNLKTKFDRILIDAPCTGSGTFLSNPELKWRQNSTFLHQNILLQEKLLKSGIKCLKPNGILVYSTCSLYPEEGELQIIKFRELLEPLNFPKWFSPSYKINNIELKGTGRLFPAIHKTQGFFVGKFKKKEI
ncbi:MAG: RsmB/NOP family class I SAM-dependent RNA methyltransferase [Promethearchaeota archaeon]